MEYKCTQCEKSFDKKRNLDRHVARMHKTPAAPPAGSPAPDPPDATSPPDAGTPAPDQAVKMVIKTDHKRRADDENTYHCITCGYGEDAGEKLTKGTAVCPKCGAGLDWSNINA